MSEAAARDLADDPKIAGVAPAMPTSLVKPTSRDLSASSDSWGISAVEAERSGYSGEEVVVAVLDTGIDVGHPAFHGQKIDQENFTASPLDDVVGHGTHCAGTIVGRQVQDHRIGIAPGVKLLLSGKILGDSGEGDTSMLFAGLQWAIDNRANIINLSMGFDFPGVVDDLVQSGWPLTLATSTALQSYSQNLRLLDAFMAMIRARRSSCEDALVVAAVGNESRRGDQPGYRVGPLLPAAGIDVVGVSALERGSAGFRIASFSNSGAEISAPGVDIISAAPGSGLVSLSGTSMAAPHVAGLAALWWEKMRSAGLRVSADLTRAKLLSSARTDALETGFDPIDVGVGLACAP